MIRRHWIEGNTWYKILNKENEIIGLIYRPILSSINLFNDYHISPIDYRDLHFLHNTRFSRTIAKFGHDIIK